MKVSNYKFLFTFIIILSVEQNFFSQEKNKLSEDCLWIKSDCQAMGSNQNSTFKENDLNQYLNFNHFVDFRKGKVEKVYKKLVSKNSVLFAVFKSSSKEENILISLESSSFKTSISNQKIICDKEVLLNKGAFNKGILLTYLYNKNSLSSRRNGNLIIEDLLFDDQGSTNQLAELIYIPRFINNVEKQIIESYLSLKYGISLNDNLDYYNSTGEVIWDFKENDGFNKRITGIGKDEAIGLNQKQSKNSLADGLIIGVDNIMKTNEENQIHLKNKEFLLWGDNGNSPILDKGDDGDAKKIMKRIWKIKSISDTISKIRVQLKIDKKLMPLDAKVETNNDDFIWLAIDSISESTFNYKNAKYIKATKNNENEVIFDNVEFTNAADYLFTIVMAKESDVKASNLSADQLSANINSEIDVVNQFLIYPNPTFANANFNIKFNLKELSIVSVKIVDITGKILKAENLGAITNYLFSSNLSVSGTFLIIICINGKIETRKLVVK